MNTYSAQFRSRAGFLVVAVVSSLLLLQPIAALAEPTAKISEEEAHSIGVRAYIYFYSLITMDVTRKQLSNVEPGKASIGGPMNMFNNIPEFPTADIRVVVRPNFDTLYSSAWLDLTKEPVIVSVPDTGGRYYLIPMLDMWTDVFASPGWRTTGTKAGNFLIAQPCWQGTVPPGVERINAPTPYVWIIGRTKTDGPKDYDAVHKIQAGYKVTPLSRWGKSPEPVQVKIDPSIDMKTPPKTQVDTMSAGKYFAYAAELLKVHPPHITDEPIVALMKRIGIEPGKSFDIDKVDPSVKKALESVPEQAQKLMEWKVPTLAKGRERLVDEYGYDGRVRQLLPQARHRRATRPRRQPTRRCDLSSESRRRDRQAPRRREQVHDPLRQSRHAARERLLVDHSVRPGRFSGREQPQSIRGQQLDAVQVQPGRFARSLFPE